MLAAACAAFATPAVAKDDEPVFVESAPVKDKPSVTLDPAKAYILLRGEGQTPMYLMKVPTAEDQAAYDRLRAEALVKAHGKYVKKLANYERDVKTAATTPGYRVSEKPIEPTEQNFEFTPFALMAAVGIGPINRFAKQGISTYLHEVTPGTYRVYGFLAAQPGVAVTGSCFCMGSVKFDAKAGEITDLGVVQKNESVDKPDGDSSYPVAMTGPQLFAVAGPDTPIDARLSAAKIVPATFRPAGKMPNYFGLTITRAPEMPGVFRYDRDRIVDLTAAR